MIWFVYNALFVVGFTLLLPRFLLRMKKRGGYARDFSHRWAGYSTALVARLRDAPRVWIHAVSVGELFVALRLMEAWRRRRPAARFVLSTTTSTGHALAEKKISAGDVLIYFPVDVPPIMRRAIAAIRPRALVLTEVELWPNLIRMLHQRGIPSALVNGRLSDRSFRGYRRLRPFTRRILPMLRLLAVQSAADRERFLALGAPPDRVRELGSAKYDIAPAAAGDEVARAAFRAAGFGPDDLILLGGSTWPGEEAALLDAWMELRSRFPALRLVLCPRHFERAAEIAVEIRRRGPPVARRSELAKGAAAPAGAVLLLDTTGELRSLYAGADLIFVGKSLTQHGGQNIIEAAACAKPILVGPNMENFAAIMEDFRAAEAVVQVADAAGLRRELERLLADAAARRALGARAGAVVRARSGAIERTLDALLAAGVGE